MDSGDSQGILQTEAQPIISGRGTSEKRNKMNEIITPEHEYYDDTYFIWRKVPSFWVGDFVSTHAHKIRLFTK